MPAVSPARHAAFEVLLAVGRGRAHADELLRGPAVSALSAADRNLATTLVLGALRWQIWLDAHIRPLLKRPQAKLDSEVAVALHLGAFQICFLDRVPTHAAIDESVELTKQSGHRFASGMVNAVLRGIARSGVRRSEAEENNPADLARAQAHPLWLVDRWVAFYGMEAARAICRYGQQQPPLSVRLQDPAVERELLASRLQFHPGALLSAARTVVTGDILASAALREGRVRIQDEGSQLIGELAAQAGRDHDLKGDVLDACAAPGGKTLILAERLPAARIVACEASAKRLADLKKRLAVHAGRITCRLADASALGDDSAFGLALADVPCSGTGTLGRNPEIRHRLQPEELARHAKRQHAILRAAIRAVRPGGRVVYSTCSLEPEENQQVVDAALSEMRHARQISLDPCIEALRQAGILTGFGAESLNHGLTPEGALRLLPGSLPTDGFFIALIEKAV